MLTFTPDDCVAFAIDYDRFDCENPAAGHGRWQYRYRITVADVPLAEATDLRCGSTTRDEPASLAEMLATLLGYFAAYSAALAYERTTGNRSENRDLFPAACRSLAEALDADQLALWAAEIYGAR
jgi:hypothetical protein